VSAAFCSLGKTQDQSGLEQEKFSPLVVRMSKQNPNGAIPSSVAQRVLLVSDQTIAMEFAPSTGFEGGASDSCSALAEFLWPQE
jgi:hypothetical protein